MRINKHDTQGTKPLLGKGELGYDDYVAGGDVGRVYVGTGTENIALAEKLEVDSHISRVDNPHSVTKAQVGLGNVDNTADVNKNVATAVLASKLGEVRAFPTDNNQDFNSCTDGGVYSILWGNFSGTLNAPPTGDQYGTLFVEASALFITQTFTTTNSNITYKRTKYIGYVWSAWTKVISEDVNGNVGIGVTPSSSLTIKDGLTLVKQFGNSTARPAVTPGVQKYGVHVGTDGGDDGFLRLSAGGGTNSTKSYIDISGYSNVSDMNRNIVFGTSGTERMRLSNSGNLLIGTQVDNGVDKLQVNGSVSSTGIYIYTFGDLDNFKYLTQTIGVYPSMSNVPIYDHGYLEVIVYSVNNWVMQRFTTIGVIDSPGRVFIRCFTNGTTWSPWVEK